MYLQLTSLPKLKLQMNKYLESYQKYFERKEFKTQLNIFRIMVIKIFWNNQTQKEKIQNWFRINRNCLFVLEMI
ncbi:unnamed protein product [Paramecium pentaurelia]|uniref:Uncharacterized protein n=1 Tax=Paramecium pentaurelia TaxID=43138 RepID=A0A8S1S2K6_9CILI|nr:unnamed protein product [Paramecium pentaurelia]